MNEVKTHSITKTLYLSLRSNQHTFITLSKDLIALSLSLSLSLSDTFLISQTISDSRVHSVLNSHLTSLKYAQSVKPNLVIIEDSSAPHLLQPQVRIPMEHNIYPLLCKKNVKLGLCHRFNP